MYWNFQNPILWSFRGLQAESSNKRKKLDEKWNIAIIENLDFLILARLGPRCYAPFIIQIWVVDRRCACESCEKNCPNEWVMKGQSWPSKQSLEKNIDFILFKTNQNLENFGIMITNDTIIWSNRMDLTLRHDNFNSCVSNFETNALN